MAEKNYATGALAPRANGERPQPDPDDRWSMQYRPSFVWNSNSLEIKREGCVGKAKDKQSLREDVMGELEERAAGRRHILLVEDDPDVREALRLFLDKKYDVIGASSGLKILEMLDSYQPILVILDVNLPGKDGFELCQLVRSSPKHRHLPVMFLTVRLDDESFVKSIQTNADAYLNKPFEAKELNDTIERLLGSR